MRRSQQSSQPTELGERLSYHGSVPANYTIEEPVRQWAPRMQRITTLGADPALADYPLPKIDWDAILLKEPKSMALALNQSIEKVWPNARWVIKGSGYHSGWQKSQSAGPVNERSTPILHIVNGMCYLQQFQLTAEYPGIFSLLSELSPTAGPEGEDLVITSRPTCLIVNEVEPGRYVVLRVVFPHDSPVGQVRLFP